MSALDRLAERMFGRQRLETTAAMASVDTQTYIGVATSDSADGSVSVVLSDDVTQPDNGIWDGDTFLASDELGTSVELPTTTSVKKGDRVLVTASGANVMTAPVVTGVVGRGDEQQAQIDAAAEAAASVEGIAQEALDGVEQVRQDVADFRDDVATTYATKVERQDGDDAVKTWVTTNYTNSNDLATTYATKTLVSQTKDAIELAASQTYETQSDAAATYATKSALTVGLDGIRSEVAEDYQPKGDYATTASMNSAIQQSASSIESSVAATYETQSDAAATYATKTEVQQTASGLDTRITTAQSTADGAYLERTATGTTIDTTGAATIRSLVVEGKSVQDGTPTPSAPVPIVSVGPTSGTSIALCCGDPVGTYTTTPIDLQGHALRSLPDGTHDELRVEERVTLVKRVGSVVLDGSIGTYSSSSNPNAAGLYNTAFTFSNAQWSAIGADALAVAGSVVSPEKSICNFGVSDYPTAFARATKAGICIYASAKRIFVRTAQQYDEATIRALLASGVIYCAPLATEQEIDLGKIDLPAPADTLWLDAAIVPTMGATWWTVGGIAGQQALDAEVTERQTLIRQFSGGVLAGYVGNAIAALVNAAGSFDVVSTTWTDGVPTVTDTLARYAANLVELGRNSTTSVIEFCGGIADLAYRGTSAILRSKTGSVGIQSGTLDLYSTTQAALIASTLSTVNDGSVQIQLGSAKPRLYAIADSVYLADTSDPYTLNKEVDMYSLIKATNCRSEGVVTMWAGTKVMTVNASSFTLFTKAELQAIVGTSWTPTGSNCSVFVMNGDHGVSANMMSASIDASSVVRVHMNATRNGSLRVNYLIIRFA